VAKTKTNKRKKTKKSAGTKVILMPQDDISAEGEEEEDESGMYLEKEDLQIIFNALREYKPSEEEVQRYDLLLEEFDEILVVDYGEPFPDVN
jgi:hypothetical protein